MGDVLSHPAIKHRRLTELRNSLRGSSESDIQSALNPALNYHYPEGPPRGWVKQRPIYIDRLKRIPPDILRDAVLWCIDNIKFFPKISELLEIAQPVIDQRRMEFNAELELACPCPCSPQEDFKRWLKYQQTRDAFLGAVTKEAAD